MVQPNICITKYFTCAIYAINYADVPNQTELFCQITKQWYLKRYIDKIIFNIVTSILRNLLILTVARRARTRDFENRLNKKPDIFTLKIFFIRLQEIFDFLKCSSQIYVFLIAFWITSKNSIWNTRIKYFLKIYLYWNLIKTYLIIF